MNLKSICRKIVFPLLSFLLFFNLSLVAVQPVPFHKGVNLANWFECEAHQIKFTKFTRTDLEQIKSLGCDVVRIPMHLPKLSGGAPDYTLDPLFFSLLDQVVGWCEELGMNVIFDNHSSGDYNVVVDPNMGVVLNKIWPQMASHYKNTSNLIFYEILNEPHDINAALWNTIQQQVITTIRTIDTKHTIIVGAVNYDQYKSLDSLSVLSDTNLIYTFHFYDPYLFTGQGTVTSNITKITGIPFPYSAERMPACPPEYIGTWMEQYLANYKNEGNVAFVQSMIDIAVKFRDERNVPIYCGEFGAYNKYCTADDRVFWYQTVRRYLEEKNIPWTIWDYHSDFGIFKKGYDYYGLFEHDLYIPLLEALNFTIPVQTPLTIVTDTSGFPIYLDYVDQNLIEKSYGTGILDFYSGNDPKDGKYCIHWEGAPQYSSLAFGFNPNQDLSFLEKNGYAVSVWIKGNNPNGQFEMRFLDSKTSDPADHPWRESMMITKSNLKWDNQWHQLIIPLSKFKETGSWDTNTWYNPEGKFDWKAVDELDIANDVAAMDSYSLEVDKLEIIKNETKPNSNPIIYKESGKEETLQSLINVHYLSAGHEIGIQSSCDELIGYQLFDVTGRKWNSGQFSKNTVIHAGDLPKGIYLIYLETKKLGSMSRKIQVD